LVEIQDALVAGKIELDGCGAGEAEQEAVSVADGSEAVV